MDKSDLRIGDIAGRREDDERWSRLVERGSRKLPCGGTKYKLTFRASPKPRRKPVRFITDKRHFAGVKAADTKLWNQGRMLVGHIQRNIMLERWEAASKWNLRLSIWLNKLFGREGELP